LTPGQLSRASRPLLRRLLDVARNRCRLSAALGLNATAPFLLSWPDIQGADTALVRVEQAVGGTPGLIAAVLLVEHLALAMAAAAVGLPAGSDRPDLRAA
jgi:hypothetical protein